MIKSDHLKAAIQAAFREKARWSIAPIDGKYIVIERERTDNRQHYRESFGTDTEARGFIWTKVMEAATAGLIRSGGQLDKHSSKQHRVG